jgi:hypothetical protein
VTALQVLHLTKQHAYFPEHRRFAESNIQVPLSADSAASLAAGCRRLRALRLSLGASDVTPEGLAALKDFSNLKRCVCVRVLDLQGMVSRHHDTPTHSWHCLGRVSQNRCHLVLSRLAVILVRIMQLDAVDSVGNANQGICLTLSLCLQYCVSCLQPVRECGAI